MALFICRSIAHFFSRALSDMFVSHLHRDWIAVVYGFNLKVRKLNIRRPAKIAGSNETNDTKLTESCVKKFLVLDDIII